MSFYLLENHVSLTQDVVQPWYTTRHNPIDLVVIHTAENLPDFDGDDSGAEAVAKFGSKTSRASWHQTVDSDSTIVMLPDGYTAWHVRGFNSRSLGVEIATQAGKWADTPEVWKKATMERLAALVGVWCDTHNIPKRLLSRAQVDAGERGIVGHNILDPSRRTDPGAGFDWGLLIGLLTQGASMSTYQDLIRDHSPIDIPDWADEAVAEYIAAGGTTVPESMNRPFFRFDMAWVWKKFIKPMAVWIKNLDVRTKALERRVAELENQAPGGSGIQRGDSVVLQ